MKKITLFAVFALLFFAQCKVVKYTPDKLPTKQVLFGEGGGFVGTETSYTLLENGQIFKQTGTDGAYKELRAIQPKRAKSIFADVNSLQLYKMDIERPGNLYYFIQEVNEHIDSRVTWGAGDYIPPQSVIAVYKELHAMVASQEVVKEGQKAASSEEDEGEDAEEVKAVDTKW